MANTVNVEKIIDGCRNAVFHVEIVGDGTGDETATTIIDVSTLSKGPKGQDCDSVSIMSVTGACLNCWATLLFDATADTRVLNASLYGEFSHSFGKYGGIPNPKNAGYTGDVLITTAGLDAGEVINAAIVCKKKYA